MLTNAVQQLHYRCLAVDLLSPAQMKAMHESLMVAAHQDGFHSLTKQISDYYQIEVSYTTSDDDIIVLVNLPCTTLTSLLTIFDTYLSPSQFLSSLKHIISPLASH